MSVDLSTTETGAGEEIQLASFDLGGRALGIDVRQIREIVRDQATTPLPRAPALIEGVVDLRGRIVPVVDLGRALGGEPVAVSPSTRLVVVETDGLTLGLRVGGAADVLTLPAAAVEAPPELLTRAGSHAVRAVVRRPDAAPLLVLSLEDLVESVHRSAGEEAAC